MTISAHEKHLKLAFELKKDIQKDNFEYTYRGLFSHNIITKILDLSEANLKKAEDAKKIRKRIYFVMMECLQNITKHQDEVEDSTVDSNGIFILQKTANSYLITTGNLIEAVNIEPLRTKLEKINHLDADELRDYYSEIMTQGEISDKGGAGLGLVAMARKSAKKLLFDFKKINEDFSYFYLRTEIDISSETSDTLKNTNLQSFEEAKQLHEILNREKILLNFNGSFDEDYIINFLSIFGSQIKGHKNIKEKVFYLMVQMLQNIVYYADKYVNNNRHSKGWKPGIFFLGESDNYKQYYLTAGNYIEREKVDDLKQRISYVNNLFEKELDEYYRKALDNYKPGSPKNHDLSIIEMRLKSENKLYFYFFDVDERYSFFTLQTMVE